MPAKYDGPDTLPAGIPPIVVAGLQNWHRLPGHIRTAIEALLGGGVGSKATKGTKRTQRTKATQRKPKGKASEGGVTE